MHEHVTLMRPGARDPSARGISSGFPLGTPAFVAPEQAMGADLDGCADIYSTGCVVYWLLTGRLVFTAETPLGIVVQHVQTPPTPPSARTELPIPRALDDLVLSCLAKHPANRPQSARELSLRLAEVDGASAWTQDRAREWWELHQPALPLGRTADGGEGLNPRVGRRP